MTEGLDQDESALRFLLKRFLLALCFSVTIFCVMRRSTLMLCIATLCVTRLQRRRSRWRRGRGATSCWSTLPAACRYEACVRWEGLWGSPLRPPPPPGHQMPSRQLQGFEGFNLVAMHRFVSRFVLTGSWLEADRVPPAAPSLPHGTMNPSCKRTSMPSLPPPLAKQKLTKS